MPTIFRDRGVRVAFTSNDCSEPPHVHAIVESRQAKFWLDRQSSLKRTMALPRTSFERRTKSLASGDGTVSITGGPTVPRPERSDVRASSVFVGKDALHVVLVDGRQLMVPLTWFPRLIEASPRERKNYELIGDGTLIHWPDVDEDIDVPNLLRL